MTTNCISGDIPTTLNYALPNPHGTPLFHIQPNLDHSKFQLNYILDPRKVVVRNIRGRLQDFSLDVNGFEYLTHCTEEVFHDVESIETKYYEEIRQLVKKHTAAERVFVLRHRIRQSYQGGGPPDGDLSRERTPSGSVHVDRTPEAVEREVRGSLGSDAERLLRGRVRFINVWRPIDHAVHHEPLALADWQTSSDEYFLLPLRIKNIYADFEAYISRFNQQHTWYYMEHQNPSEVVLIKCYDSRADGGAKFCLHSAFSTDGCHRNAPRRRSIEVNTLVFG